jgi:two-component system, OmpR family, sensor histidine kinase KdpD
MAEDFKRPSADAVLARIKASEELSRRGKLKIFLGYAAGVGKTYAMLQEAHQRKAEGIDVVVAYVDTHGRTETEFLLTGLELIARKQLEYRGVKLTEMDIDAVLKRKPSLALVDELAHTNAPNSRYLKRHQDVEELLSAGIDVYTTLNIQHVSSLQSVIAQVTGIWIRETIPDSFIEEANEIKVIDLPPDDLLERLKQGKVYLTGQVKSAIDNFFRKGNLIALRELTMRAAAEHVDEQMNALRQETAVPGTWSAAERILVCVSPTKSSSRLVRMTRRLARQLNAEWFAVYVETPEAALSDEEQDYLSEALNQAEHLGGEVLTVQGDSVAGSITDVANTHKVTRILMGRPERTMLQKLLFRPTLMDQLVKMNEGRDVYILGDIFAEPKTGIIKKEFHPAWANYLSALGLVVIASLINLLLKPFISPTNLAMIYLLVVAISAFNFGLGPAILISLVSVITFDYFFIPPYLSFQVADLEYLLTFAALLTISLLISYLGWRLRRQSRSARRREMETASLFDLSRKLTAVSDMESTIRTILISVKQLVKSNVVVFLPDDKTTGKLRSFTAEGAPVVDENEAAVAFWVYQHSQSAGHDTDTLPSAQALHMPMTTTRGVVGVMSIWPDATRKLTMERRKLLESLIGISALAIERVHLVQAAYDIQVKEAVEKLQTALLNSVSHDLHTPLSSIMGVLETLQDNSLKINPDARARMIELAVQEAERLNRLVGNLLDVSRIDSGAMKLFLQQSDIGEVIQAAVEQSSIGRVSKRPVNIDIPDGTPDIFIDFGLVLQCFKNVLDNSDKYSPPGLPVDVKVRLQDQSLKIEIADRGIGIPEDDLEKVFNKFYRVQRPTNVSGSGLGLSICKGIIEAHGGHISAEGRPGGGTTIRISIPLNLKK